MAAKIIPEITSTTKCCLRVRVEIDTRTAQQKYKILIHEYFRVYWERFTKNKRSHAKVTWPDGKVLCGASINLVISMSHPDTVDTSTNNSRG